MDELDNRPAENGDLDEHIADLNYTTKKDTKRSIRFVEYLAKKYTSPEDIWINHRTEISHAATSVGVILPDILILDSAWHYVPNREGKDDKKQSYKGEYRTDAEGATTPSMTVHNFKEESLSINIRDMAFQEYEAYKFGNSVAPLNGNIEAYKASSARLATKAAAQKIRQGEKESEGHKAAAKAAASVWNKAQDNPEHPYLERKKIGAHGTRIATERLKARLWDRYEDSFQEVVVCEAGELIIPVRDSTTHDLINIQRVSQDKDKPKRFLHGGQTTGGYNGLPGKGMEIVCEGFATGATVAEAGGYSVLVAFSAGNIPNVTKAISSIKAVAADNDKAGIKAAQATGLRFAVPPTEGADWNDYAVKNGLEAATQELKTFEESLVREGIVKAPKPTLLVPTAEFMATPKPLTWSIKDIFEDKSIGMMYGPSGGGKSFVAISMAASIGAGVDWFGRKVKQGAVVYVNGEGHVGLARRFKAWEIETGTPISNVYPTRVPVLFGNPDSVKQLSEEMSLLPEQPSLVIIDTLARAAAGMDENGSQDMGLFIENLDNLRRDHGCSVLIVHHSGKNADSGARGSSVIKAAMDFEMELKIMDPKALRLFCTKMKEADRFKPMSFEISTVKLPNDWVNDDGERLTSAVLLPVENKDPDSKDAYQKRKLPDKQEQALSILKNLQESQIETLIDGGAYDPNSPPLVLKSDWVDAMEKAGIKSHRSYPGKLELKQLVRQHGCGDLLGYLRI